MQFLTFEDETGLVETVLFPQAYRRLAGLLDWNRPFLLRGSVSLNYGAATLEVDQATPLGGLG